MGDINKVMMAAVKIMADAVIDHIRKATINGSYTYELSYE